MKCDMASIANTVRRTMKAIKASMKLGVAVRKAPAVKLKSRKK